MRIFRKPIALHEFLERQRTHNKIGFVPTMGALHPGHLSLLNEANKKNQIVVCSIFVNPTQFNDPEDFKKYPITIENDIRMLHDAACDALFLPSVHDIYPNGTEGLPHYDLGFLETVLEGKFRPGHFQGVCQVMHRLLEIVLPNNLYVGQKDYQQCMVMRKLIELIGLEGKINLNILPTLRENDGLAMSSRNARLGGEDRHKATTISQSLRYIKENIQPGRLQQIKNEAHQMLLEDGFIIDYLEIADAKTLQSVDEWDGKQKIVVLAAAFLNNVRLIDNTVIDQ